MAKQLQYRVEIVFKIPADSPDQAVRILDELKEYGQVIVKSAHSARQESE